MFSGKLSGAGRSGVVALLFLFVLSLAPQLGCQRNEKTEFVGFPQSFADLAEKVMPAVVNISTTSTVRIPGHPFRHFFGQEQNDPFDDFFRHFFHDLPDREMKQQSLGSGFIINKDGYIITNNHVVDKADDIKVRLSDGREFTAKVVGRDNKTDLALIKISTPFESLPILTLGDSEKIRVGDWVMAVGNPFGLEQTVTQGIISATGRVIGSGPYDNFLQTDAPINPGNSGGPLVNLKGEVIGINTAINPAGQGIGFAIPSSLARAITTQLQEKGKVVRGWIGVTIQPVTPELARSFGISKTRGALVSNVAQGGPAERGGVRRGDIIIAFDGKEIKNASDLPRLVAATALEKSVAVTVLRESKEVALIVKVEELTEEKMAGLTDRPAENFGLVVENLTPQLRQHFRSPEMSGVMVVRVDAGSPADEARIAAGDVIKELNRRPIRNLADYQTVLGQISKGSPALFLLRRGGQTFFVSLVNR